MWFLISLAVVVVLSWLVFGSKSLLRYFLYCRRMRKLYFKYYAESGFDNGSALTKTSKARHPELSDQVHQELALKFNELGALTNFIYWGLEADLSTKFDSVRELTDETALALVRAGSVVLDGYRYRVKIDRNRLH